MCEVEVRPTISVVVPVYNVAPYVERCLLSVMKQTYPAAECIIVDDCSTDGSIARCQQLIYEYKGDTRFTVIRHDRNRGLSATRNTGTDAATSGYIYYLDSDDEITSDCLEKLVAPVIHDNRIEMVLGSFRASYSESIGKRSIKDHDMRFVKDELLKLDTNEDVRKWYYSRKFSWPDHVWNKLLKLSFVKENGLYNKEGQLFEDLLWTYYLMRYLNYVVFIPDVTYINYRRKGSIVTDTTFEKRLLHYGHLFKEMADHIVQGERVEETERWLWDFCHHYIDASDNPDYRYAYTAFHKHLSDGRHRCSLTFLTITDVLSKSLIGHHLFKVVMIFDLCARRVRSLIMS